MKLRGPYCKGRLVPILFGCIACATLALVCPRGREPEYNGVPLSVWLKGYGNPQMTYSAVSLEALYRSISATRHIGTNALPFLLRWIQYERPGWRKSFDRLAWELPPGVLNTRAGRWLLADVARDRAYGAVAGFAFLNTNATPAVPELRRFAKDAGKPETQYRADLAVMVVSARVPVSTYDEIPNR